MEDEITETARSFKGRDMCVGEDVGSVGVGMEAPIGSVDNALEGKALKGIGKREWHVGSGGAGSDVRAVARSTERALAVWFRTER